MVFQSGKMTCRYCFAPAAVDAYGICPTCRKRATKNSAAGRIVAGALKDIERRQERRPDDYVYKFNEVPADFERWAS